MCDFVCSQAYEALEERIRGLPEAQQGVARRLLERMGVDFVEELLDKIDEIAAKGGPALTREDLIDAGFDPEEVSNF
jgi:hypothetical protein